MNRRELILVCIGEVIMMCLLFCGVGMIFHGCDGENDAIEASAGSAAVPSSFRGWSSAMAAWKRSIPVPDASSRSRCWYATTGAFSVT